MADDDLTELLGEQIAYYRARAIEYDRTAPYTEEDGYQELLAALERFAPGGRVLELACGTGLWTKELAEYASQLTAVDASEEMLALNRANVGRKDVVYVKADMFARGNYSGPGPAVVGGYEKRGLGIGIEFDVE